jgi:hypothetical protein
LFSKDIWDFENNDFISIDTLLRKLKCTRNWIAEWHILKSSIPKMYITALKDHHYETVSHYTHLDDSVLTSKTQTKILPESIKIKQIFHIWNQKSGQLKTESKWES